MIKRAIKKRAPRKLEGAARDAAVPLVIRRTRAEFQKTEQYWRRSTDRARPRANSLQTAEAALA